MATLRQTQMLAFHRNVCTQLQIPQSTFQHLGLKGTVSAPNMQGNLEYKGPGPVTTYAGAAKYTGLVWLVYQPFIRGEERADVSGAGIVETALEEGQMPSIDDSGTFVQMAEDDLVTTVDGTIFNVINPVLSPDQGWWTFLLEMKR